MAGRRRRPPVHAVVMAGGAGERFWPASRARRPKPLLEVVGGRTLLDATLARARRVAGPDRVWLVCGREHAPAVRRAAGLPAARVLVEPRRRNTASAALWASLRVAAEDREAVVVLLPADHHVPDARLFAADVRRAVHAADRARVLVTLGIPPTRPETGYGYIQEGPEVGPEHPGLRRVRRFVEKPDAARARRYLAAGGYRWNAGIFVWRADSFAEEVEACAPDLHRAFAPLRRRPRARRAPLEEAYRRAPSLPVDVAVMERSRRVWTLPARFPWSDVGTWGALADQLGVGQPSPSGEGGRQGNRVVDGDVLFEASRDNLVWGGRRLVALLGVERLAVVDTDDVILVTDLDRSPDVRKLVGRLKADGRGSLT